MKYRARRTGRKSANSIKSPAAFTWYLPEPTTFVGRRCLMIFARIDCSFLKIYQFRIQWNDHDMHLFKDSTWTVLFIYWVRFVKGFGTFRWELSHEKGTASMSHWYTFYINTYLLHMGSQIYMCINICLEYSYFYIIIICIRRYIHVRRISSLKTSSELFSPLSPYHDDAPKDRQLEKAVKKIPGFVRLPLASYQFNPYILPR